MARVLITGASGLIGRRVIEAFATSEDTLIALGRKDADLLLPGSWERVIDRERPDAIVHLAWSASAMPDYREHADNWRWSETTIGAAEAAAQRGIRFLATGTSVDDVDGADAYSRSKAATRIALADRIAAGQIAWLRPFYVFDEDRPSPAVLRAALAALAAGEPVRLASPHALHDFVHARDVASALRTIVERDLSGPIDLGSGRLTAVSALVESFGCAWVEGGPAGAAASTSAVAETVALAAAGWSPAASAARLGWAEL